MRVTTYSRFEWSEELQEYVEVYEEGYEYKGEVELCKGGGSAAGTVEYPTYIKDIQGDWLASSDPDGVGRISITSGYTMVDLLNTALVANTPYNGETAYNPDSYLAPIQTQFTTFKTKAEALSEQTDWESFVDTVVAKANASGTFSTVDILDSLSTAVSDALSAISTALSSQPITDAVDGYESEQTPRFMRSVSRFTASLAEVNAVQTTSFGMGLALMESEFNNDVNKFEANLKMETFKDILVPSIQAHVQAEFAKRGYKDAFISQSVQAISQLLKTRVTSLQTAASLLAEINRISVVAKKEENDMNIELDVRDALWDLELYQHGANLMAAAPGGVGSSAKQSLTTGQSMLGGALSGASVGAEVAGPWGAVAGAAVGGILGAF